MTGRPLLRKAQPSVAGKKKHVSLHRHGDKGDGGRLHVVTRSLETDNQKRHNQVDRQHH
jgi:hypothetical protein